MLSDMADGRKLTPFVILRRKNLPKEKLPTGILLYLRVYKPHLDF
jgi:hypothetical protein